jgi:hypothetical protein
MMATYAELINEEHASTILKVSTRTLQAWRVRGYGPKFRKLGRAVRYRLEDVHAFVNENVHQSTSEKSYRVKDKVLTV